jgi:hypothetical protein
VSKNQKERETKKTFGAAKYKWNKNLLGGSKSRCEQAEEAISELQR